MNSFTVYFPVLLGIIFLHVVSCFEDFHGPFPLNQLSENFSVRTTICGGILHETSGEISYKRTETFNTNERCIWVIRSKGATGYAVGLFHLGFPASQSEHQIIISGFAHGRENVTEVLPSETGLYTLSNCNLIVITFQTGDNVSSDFTGFSLQYSSLQNDGIVIPSERSRDVILGESTLGHVRHPETGSYYGVIELSTFLFIQRNRSENPWELVNIVIALNGLGPECVDFLDVYTFNKWRSTQKWEKATRICASNLTSTFTNDDAIFVVFQSDRATIHEGFHMMYSRCSRGE